MISLISIGYSAFSNKLSINNIKVNFRIKEDIRITSFLVVDYKDAVSYINEYNKDNVSGSINLSNSDSYIKYKVEVTNIGNSMMSISSITIDNNDLEYIISGYNIGDMLCDNSKCLLGSKTEFYITIRSKQDSAIDSNFILSFDFVNSYDVTVNGIDNLIYKKDISRGSNYILDLSSYDNIDKINVYENNVIREYSYEDGMLLINNVMGNIMIDIVTYQKKDFVIEDGISSYVIDRISEDTPISVKELLNMEFNGENISSKVIYKIDVVIKYNSNTGSNQSINSILEYDGNSFSKLVSFNGNTSNGSVMVSFDNLNILVNSEFVIRNEINKLTNSNIDIIGKSINVYFK